MNLKTFGVTEVRDSKAFDRQLCCSPKDGKKKDVENRMSKVTIVYNSFVIS
jgi:hypothetical protein